MSQEIAIALSITFSKTGITTGVSRSVASLLVDVSGSKYVQAVQNINTSAEAISMGEITSPGLAYFKNLDATNYIKIRNGASGADLLRLKPGESALVRLETTAVPYAIANSSACNLEYLIIED